MIGLTALVAVACSGGYRGVPRTQMLQSQCEPTQGNLHALATAYGEAINSAVKADTIHPGMYAEYGIALALAGHRGEAVRMLNTEAARFPQSRAIVERVKARLLPDLKGDTTTARGDTADLGRLLAWAPDSLAALLPVAGMASVIDSSDSVRVAMQTPVDSIPYEVRLSATQKRILLQEEQSRAERERKARQDSVAAAKQARVDARKQAEADKKAAKKQAEKDKKAAAKEKERQRKEQLREREAQRQAEKERREAERKAQKEAAKSQKSN